MATGFARLLAGAVVVAVVATGCTHVVAGRPSASGTNPYEVGGKPVTEEPSGLRPNAPGPTRTVLNGDGGSEDYLAAMAINDIEEFWAGAYGPTFGGDFVPVDALFSYDSRFKHGAFCGGDTAGSPNAAFCFGTESDNCPITGECTSAYNTIGWDRGVYIPKRRASFGDMGVVATLAHEYGHAVSHLAGLLDVGTQLDALVAEQQADCFAGAYMWWVEEKKSPRFSLSTGADGLSMVLASRISVRDPLVGADNPLATELVHGSAFERVSALQMGFAEDGAERCGAIDIDEINARRGGLPQEFLDAGQTGEFPVTEQSITDLVRALDDTFSPAEAPKLEFAPPVCSVADPTPAASYCPSTNVLSVDMDRMVLMGTSLSRGSPASSRDIPLFGDYSAYSMLISRYVLALQNERGDLSLKGIDAGLRTACLAGYATKALSAETSAVRTTGGDLDEAVAGVLTNGLAASDVDGMFAPAGFARVDAFRTGVLGTEANCYARWP